MEKEICECKRDYKSPLSGICELCWDEKYPDEKVCWITKETKVKLIEANTK